MVAAVIINVSIGQGGELITGTFSCVCVCVFGSNLRRYVSNG